MPFIRPGEPRDLEAVRAIQVASPSAAQWEVAQYLLYDLLIATNGVRLSGFLSGRHVAAGEYEILNLAVAPDCRRQGVARSLVEAYLHQARGWIFLEVRSSNQAALWFYRSLGFEEVTTRPDYYQDPPEAAIVMKFHSC